MTVYRKPLVLRQQFNEWKNDPSAPAQTNPGANKANMGHVQKAIPFIGAKESRDREVDQGLNRHLVFGYLFCDLAQPFRPMRSGELTHEMWFALARWIEAKHIEETGKWKPQPAFKRECKWVWNIADYCLARTEEETDLPFGALLSEDLDQVLPESDLDDSFVNEIQNVGHAMIGQATGENVQSRKRNTGEWDGQEPIGLDAPAEQVPEKPKEKPLSESLMIPDEW